MLCRDEDEGGQQRGLKRELCGELRELPLDGLGLLRRQGHLEEGLGEAKSVE